MYNVEYKDWRKIQGYARSAHKLFGGAEIGGMAVMEEVEKGEWWLKDPIILKQEVTGGTCSLDQEELANYYTSAAIKRKKNKNRYRFLWWHSHHTMGAFWSGTDDKAIDEFSDGDISFALVVSWKVHPDEHILRISQWDPEEHHTDTEFDIVNKPEYNHIAKSIVTEVEEKCEKPFNNIKSTGMTSTGFGYRSPSAYTGWQQQSLFDNKKRLPNTINKMKENDWIPAAKDHTEAFSMIIELISNINDQFLEKQISWDIWEEQFATIEEWSETYDYILDRPHNMDIALSWIKGKKIEEWLTYDPDMCSWNGSFGVSRGYH